MHSSLISFELDSDGLWTEVYNETLLRCQTKVDFWPVVGGHIEKVDDESF